MSCVRVFDTKWLSVKNGPVILPVTEPPESVTLCRPEPFTPPEIVIPSEPVTTPELVISSEPVTTPELVISSEPVTTTLVIPSEQVTTTPELVIPSEPITPPENVKWTFQQKEDLRLQLESAQLSILRRIARTYGQPNKGKKQELVNNLFNFYSKQTPFDPKGIFDV